MRNRHPIWFVRYVVEDFPSICIDLATILLAGLWLLGQIIFYDIVSLNVTLYKGIMLLYNKVYNYQKN